VMTAPQTVTGNFAVAVTIASTPAGLAFSVSGSGCQPGAYTAGATLLWQLASSCGVSFTTPQSGGAGTQYVFTAWADGPTTASRTITTPAAATTYTANFTTQYLLTTLVSPAASGTLSGAGYYNAGATASVSATPLAGYGFVGFSGALTGAVTPQTLVMNAPKTVTGNFALFLTSGSKCNGTYTGTFNGDVTVTNGQTCVLVGGGITGNVTQNGGSLAISNSTIGGNVQVQGGGTSSIGPSAVIVGNLQIQNIPVGTAPSQVCSTTVKGNVQFQNNGTEVQIGALPPSPCAGNNIGGNLTIQNNTAAASAVGNTVGNNLTVQNNTAATFVDNNHVTGNLQDQNNTAPTQVFTNIVGNNLQCQSDPSITGGGNTAKSKQGQCSTF